MDFIYIFYIYVRIQKIYKSLYNHTIKILITIQTIINKKTLFVKYQF